MMAASHRLYTVVVMDGYAYIKMTETAGVFVPRNGGSEYTNLAMAKKAALEMTPGATGVFEHKRRNGDPWWSTRRTER